MKYDANELRASNVHVRDAICRYIKLTLSTASAIQICAGCPATYLSRKELAACRPSSFC